MLHSAVESLLWKSFFLGKITNFYRLLYSDSIEMPRAILIFKLYSSHLIRNAHFSIAICRISYVAYHMLHIICCISRCNICVHHMHNYALKYLLYMHDLCIGLNFLHKSKFQPIKADYASYFCLWHPSRGINLRARLNFFSFGFFRRPIRFIFFCGERERKKWRFTRSRESAFVFRKLRSRFSCSNTSLFFICLKAIDA